MKKLVVVSHDPNWQSAFEAESRQVAAAFGENVIAIHHIGIREVIKDSLERQSYALLC